MDSVRSGAATLAVLIGAVLGIAGGKVASAATVNLPDVTVTSLGHSHFFDMFMGGNTTDGVAIPSGMGSYTSTSYLGQANNGDTITQRILAPAGQKFSVDFNPSFGSQGFLLNLYWQAGGDAASTSVTPTVTFENLIGTAPTSTYSQSSLGNAGNFIRFEHQATVTDDFSFTGMTLSFPVTHSTTVSGNRTFNVGSFSSTSFGVFGSSTADIDATLMSLTPVPEPSGFALFLTVAAALFTRRRIP